MYLNYHTTPAAKDAAVQARAPAFQSEWCKILGMDHYPRYWHSRGYLPHVDKEGFTQFITFRLADSMPQDVLNRWRSDLENGEITDADFRKRIDFCADE